MRVSEGARHLVASAAVVLLAPMTMAAASIEGSPLRDAIRGPFERLGIVSPESARDGATPDGTPAPAAPDAATGGRQADPAQRESAVAGGEAETAPATGTAHESLDAPAVEPVPPPAEEAPPAEAPPEPSPEPAVPPAEGELGAPEDPEGDAPVLGEDPLDDLLGLAPELGAEMPSP